MRPSNITPENTEFIILSFEGPDRYSMVGDLGIRVNHLSRTLAEMGFRSHLFFIGDPKLRDQETRYSGKLTLYRWCQWISKYYPNGVYEGEEEKLYDFNESIPWFLAECIIGPAVEQGKLMVVLGEDWHTAEAMCRLSDVLYNRGLRDQVVMFWNANSTLSFHRINWGRLDYTTTITTVSRHMKHLMWGMGLNPLVIPNGIPRGSLRKVSYRMAEQVRKALGADMILCKVARWDPDKGWGAAVEAIVRLKERGLKAVLLVRGWGELYGKKVLQRAHSLGLTVKEARARSGSTKDCIAALQEAAPADIIDVESPLTLDLRRSIYWAADCVLANNDPEPFDLVGLEAMAAGGVTLTGTTGEDYAIPFINSFVLDTRDPLEIVSYAMYLKDHPEEGARIRNAARHTARSFTWEAAVRNLIGKLEYQARAQGALSGLAAPCASPAAA